MKVLDELYTNMSTVEYTCVVLFLVVLISIIHT